MAEKPLNGAKAPVPVETSVLGLLGHACVNGAATFTLYTSRKGRIWVTTKSWGDVPFATSVEVATDAGAVQVAQAMLVSLVGHLAKALGKAGRIDTWYRLPVDPSVTRQALDWVPYAMEQLANGASITELSLPPYTQGEVMID